MSSLNLAKIAIERVVLRLGCRRSNNLNTMHFALASTNLRPNRIRTSRPIRTRPTVSDPICIC